LRSRSGKKQLWIMANNNETWIDPITLENIDKIYDFLLVESKKSWRNNRKTPKYSYSQLSEHTSINVKQVQFACQKLAYKIDPYIRIHAMSFGFSEGVKTSEKVELIRVLDNKNADDSNTHYSHSKNGGAL
jgi:hypothetical protein